MQEDNHMPTVSTSNSQVSDLVSAGENAFKALTGSTMSDNQQKVSDGITRILDGLLPGIESRVSIDLADVLGGATDTLNGVARTVTGAKTKQIVATASTETTATETTAT